MTAPNELDSILKVVENPVRRKIIKRLSQEPSYPLELSKELGMGQQLVASHLGIMERQGILDSSIETSPMGPSRKVYFLKKSVYLSVGFGPHLYSEQALSFDTIPKNVSEDAARFMN
jgi:predicted transcriptional regulator